MQLGGLIYIIVHVYQLYMGENSKEDPDWLNSPDESKVTLLAGWGPQSTPIMGATARTSHSFRTPYESTDASVSPCTHKQHCLVSSPHGLGNYRGFIFFFTEEVSTEI